jgi:hypothetical protein
MTIEHKDIPDGNRHEPKGASTAPLNAVYVSDGAGSGSWTQAPLSGQASTSLGQIIRASGGGSYLWKHSPEGWGYYKHSGAAQVVSSTYSKLIIDGLEGTSNSSYLPYEIRGTGELWDSVANKITPLTTGDSYDVRIDLPVTAEGGNPTEITISLDIGGSASPTIIINTDYISAGKSLPYQPTFLFDIFTLTTFLANGGQVFLKTDVGTITVSSPAIKITRKTAGDF